MPYGRVIIWVYAYILAAGASAPLSAMADQVIREFENADGLVDIHLDRPVLDKLGLSLTAGERAAASRASYDLVPAGIQVTLTDDAALSVRGAAPLAGPRLLLGATPRDPDDRMRPAVQAATLALAYDSDRKLWILQMDEPPRMPLFVISSFKPVFSDENSTVEIRGALTIAPELAAHVERADAAGRRVGVFTAAIRLQATRVLAVDEHGHFHALDSAPAATARAAAGGNSGTICPTPVGTDVIVGDLIDISNYTASSGFEAYAVGTTSCNVGDANLSWVASTNQHPVIGQNAFRLKDDRFTQIGQSWLKHGFTALTQNICGCGCSGQGGSVLGVGCSDPYCCGLNGSQGGLGPKWDVNAHTGFFNMPFPFDDVGPGGGNADGGLYKRMQVRITDLDPAADGGGQYFVEGHYIAPDDAISGNGNNNASYREVTVGGGGTSWTLSFAAPTAREQPGIRAWQDADPTVVETDIQIPGEGLVIVAGKSVSIGGGFFRYEYAVQNLNSDRSVGSFSIPIASDAVIQNTGFHDVDYHSGDPNDSFDPTPYTNVDWIPAVTTNAVTWSSVDFATDPDANALRWGTMYSFWFEANDPPISTTATLGLFKPGTPSSVSGGTTGPAIGPQDCNNNGTEDGTDIANGTSRDCNGNGIPDECETFTPCALTSVVVASGLNQPVGLSAPPADLERLFVVEQPGTIRIISSGTLLPTPFLDIASLVSSGGERGLLSMAFAPDYASTGHFFVYYTNTAGDTVIARYTVSGNPDSADAGSAVILKTIAQDFSNHNGGQLQFGPDGMLYTALGDGGSANDPNNRAQDDGSLLGKMLRLDVDNPPNYIPADNPFVGGGDPLDEIWSKGWRNPWRFSFDRQTGDLYVGDVGQDAHEEVSFEAAGNIGGDNYGWRCMEGDACTGLSGCTCNGPALTLPILDIAHSANPGTCSVIGGYVYRGCDLPGFDGTYFFADFCANYIRSFEYADGDPLPPAVTDRTTALNAPSSIVAFGEDAAGEMYIVSQQGIISKIVCSTGGVCGNGIPEAGEQCDDGNTNPGDGCDENCQIEAGGNLDLCDGASPIFDGATPYSNVGAGTDGQTHPECGDGFGDEDVGSDVWFNYIATCTGTLTASTCNTADYDTKLGVYDGCACPASAILGCDDDTAGCAGNTSEVVVPVTGGQCYKVRVGGFQGAQGSGTITISCSGTPVGFCGNGTVDDGETCDPPDGVTCDCSCQAIDDCMVVFTDNFDCDLGWAVQSENLTDGAWERGDPAGDGTRWDPTDDFDGGGACYLTDNVVGNSDVDGGPTRVLSPVLDLTRAGMTLTYAYWFGWDDGAGTDSLMVEATTNGTDWTLLAEHNAVNVELWQTNSVVLEDFITPTATTRVRFSTTDNPNDSVVEAAFDTVTFAAPCFDDCNANGIDDLDDIANCAGDPACADCNSNQIPDGCELAGDPALDCDGGPVGVVAAGEDIILMSCFGCHNVDGSGGTGFPGPNIRGKSRVEIWNMLDNPTSGHPGGQFPNFVQQDYADLEAFLSDDGSRGRPDLVLDACQTLADCDTDNATDGCELEAGTQDDLDFDGVPDDCQNPCVEPCDDGNPCTTGDTCVANLCQGTPVDCAGAGDACNVATCNINGPEGNCDILTPLADGTACDDGNACSVGDVCDGGSCASGLGPNCGGAGDQCTTASCDPGGQEGNCDVLTPVTTGTPCTDGSGCSIGDVCDAGQCLPGLGPDCSDAGDDCNEAACDPAAAEGNCDVLIPVANGTACDDDNACSIDDVCDAGTCEPGPGPDCSGGGDQCTATVCDPNGAEGNCDLVEPLKNGTACDDGNVCSLGDVCMDGDCAPGLGPNCSAFDTDCTAAFCDPAGAKGNCADFIATNEGGPCNNGDGVCEAGVCLGTPCSTIADCADINDDGIRDDGCLWWACTGGLCASTSVPFADLGGEFGSCPPDGTPDGNDRFHALNCFANIDPNTPPPSFYPCEDDAPNAMNVDAGGQFGDCNPDGVCDGNDAFHALNAFSGDSLCACPLGGPGPDVVPEMVDTLGIELRTATPVARSGALIDIEVWIDRPAADLRGYQLHLGTQAGKRGALELVDIRIDDRPVTTAGAHVFDGLGYWKAFNVETGQMVAGLDTPGVVTEGPAYLATFTYKASPKAAGRFIVELLDDVDDPTERTFLFPTAPAGMISIDRADTLSITVEAGPRRRAR